MNLIITNPRLLLWPDSKVMFAIAESHSRVRSIYPFSINLLKLLKYCLNPISFDQANEFLLTLKLEINLADLIEKEILIKQQDFNPIDAWHGLKVNDTSQDFIPSDKIEPIIQDRTIDNYPIFVIDHLFSERCIQTMTFWFQSQSFSLNDVDSHNNAFSTHWIRKLDQNFKNLLSIPIFSWLDATSRYYFHSIKLSLIEAKAYVTPYGDTPTYHCDSEITETVTAILYVHQNWELDWGGELIISDSSGDPQIAVFPHTGRVVVFRGDLPHKAGTPSRLAFSPRLAIVLRYNSE